MKILLINPPFLPMFSRTQRSPAVTKNGTLYYPYWLSYATGFLEKHGHEVKLLDAPARRMELSDIQEETRKFQPEMIVLETSTPSIYNDVKAGDILKGLHPESFIVLVGTHVSALPDETLRLSKQIDAVARGEYDETLVDLAKVLHDKGDLNDVKGINFQLDGNIACTPDRVPVADLDAFPFVSDVYKRHLHVEDYFYASLKYPMLTMLSARGCPHNCTFCVYPQIFTGRNYRTRSVMNVVDELEYVQSEIPQVMEIFFEDDVLPVSSKRTRHLSEEIIRRGIKIAWSANARANVDLETLQMMKQAGCRLLCVGFESGDQEILDNMQKKMKVERMLQFMNDAKKARILIHGCFLAGIPGETRETLNKTLDLALKLNPYTAQFFPMMVYPGTKAYQWYKERGYIQTDDFSRWLTKDGYHNCIVNTPELTGKDLVRFCDNARRAFYLRPKYILSMIGRSLFSHHERKHLWRGFRSSLPVIIKGSTIN